MASPGRQKHPSKYFEYTSQLYCIKYLRRNRLFLPWDSIKSGKTKSLERQSLWKASIYSLSDCIFLGQKENWHSKRRDPNHSNSLPISRKRGEPRLSVDCSV